MTNCSEQVHQFLHNRGLKGETNLCRIVGGSTRKIHAIKQMIPLRGGRVPGPLHYGPFSVHATLVPLAQQMAKRSGPFTDEASNDTGASSKSKPESKRVLALASVRHEKSSPLISAQEKTQSDVRGQENPSQANSLKK